MNAPGGASGSNALSMPAPAGARRSVGLLLRRLSKTVTLGEYVSLGIAIAALGILGEQWAYACVFLGALGFAAYNRKHGLIVLSLRQAGVLALVLVALGVGLKLLLDVIVVTLLAWLLTAAAILKLLPPRRARDHFQIMALSVIIMGASTVLTTLPLFPLFLAAFTVSAIWTMLALDLLVGARRSLDDCVLTERVDSVSKRLFGQAKGLALGALCLAAGFFLFIPRVRPYFLWVRPKPQPYTTSGFSRVMALDDTRMIFPSDKRVFEVALFRNGEPYSADGKVIYMRGTTLTYYDERHRWWEAEDALLSVPWNPQPNVEEEDVIEQHFLRQQIYTVVIFGWPEIVDLKAPAEYGFALKQCPFSGSITMSKRYDLARRRRVYPLKYTVYSVDTQQPVSILRECGAFSDEEGEELRPYLDTSGFSSEVVDLARQICPEDEYETPYAKARRIEQYIRDSHAYSLALPEEGRTEPIARFLFDTRVGHCELFASAMVALCRSVGVPARLATGYAGGEYNRLSKAFLFRQSNAHAWVEVLYKLGAGEGTGAGRVWQRHDPTPVAGDYDLNLKTGWLKSLYYLIADRWYKHVIDYGPEDQRGLYAPARSVARLLDKSLVTWSRNLARRFRSLRRLGTRGIGAVAGGLAVVILIVFIAVVVGIPFVVHALWRRVLRAGRARRGLGDMPVVALYRRMLAILARAGYRKHPAETINEFLAGIDPAVQAALIPATEIARLYEGVRFGSEALSTEAARRFGALLKTLKETLSSR